LTTTAHRSPSKRRLYQRSAPSVRRKIARGGAALRLYSSGGLNRTWRSPREDATLNRFIGLIDSGRVGDEAALKRAYRLLAKRVHPDLAAGPSAGTAGPSGGPGAEGLPSSDEAAARRFVAIRAEYEEARAYLAGLRPSAAATDAPASRGAAATSAPAAATPAPAAATKTEAPTLRFERRAFYESLEDLLGRGFPHRPLAAGPGRRYDASRGRFLGLLAGRDEVYPEERAARAFLAFEAAYAALPLGAGFRDAGRRPNRILYYFLSNILGYHRMGFKHLAVIARSLAAEARGEAALRAGPARVDTPRVEPAREDAGGSLPFVELLVADLARGPAALD